MLTKLVTTFALSLKLSSLCDASNESTSTSLAPVDASDAFSASVLWRRPNSSKVRLTRDSRSEKSSFGAWKRQILEFYI
jgi:hypothetical protein